VLYIILCDIDRDVLVLNPNPVKCYLFSKFDSKCPILHYEFFLFMDHCFAGIIICICC